MGVLHGKELHIQHPVAVNEGKDLVRGCYRLWYYLRSATAERCSRSTAAFWFSSARTSNWLWWGRSCDSCAAACLTRALLGRGEGWRAAEIGHLLADALEHLCQPGERIDIAVCGRVAMVARVIDSKSAFFRVIVWGLKARSTMLESISIDSSRRKRPRIFRFQSLSL
jgi:hypothetical protein